MNRVVLFDQDQLNNYQFILKDKARVQHLNSHLRVNEGDFLKASVINQGLAQVKVITKTESEITLEVQGDYQRPTHPILSLVVATSRPPTMKKVIEHGTTLGVKHFHFFSSALGEKSYLKSKVLEKEKLNELATLGIAQSGQLWEMPTFQFSDNLREAFEKQSKISTQMYLLSLQGKTTLLGQKPDKHEKPAFFIGPERGWTKQEEGYLIENKVIPLLLSQHILRVETAAFALLSQMELLHLS